MKSFTENELLLVEFDGRVQFAVYLKESYIRDRNVQVQLVDDLSKIWLRKSSIL